MDNKPLKVGLIVEADFQIGMGHVSRCVDIYNEFRKNNFDCEFIIPNNSNLINWLTDKKIQFKIVNIDNWSLLDKIYIKEFDFLKTYNILFVDLIENSFTKFSFLNSFTQILIVSITLLYFSEDIRYEDVSFFPDIESKPKDFIINKENKKISLYSGSDYFTFRDEFNNKNYEIENRKDYKLMISMGGSDPYRITDVVYNQLRDLKIDFRCNVVLGNANDRTKQDFPDKRFSIIRSVTNISKLMLESDLVFISGGLTRYELAVLGVPFVAVSINEIQYEINQRFLKLVDESLNVGIYNQINSEQFENLTTSLLENKDKRKIISNKLLGLIDTKGASRIVDIAINKYYELKNI